MGISDRTCLLSPTENATRHGCSARKMARTWAHGIAVLITGHTASHSGCGRCPSTATSARNNMTWWRLGSWIILRMARIKRLRFSMQVTCRKRVAPSQSAKSCRKLQFLRSTQGHIYLELTLTMEISMLHWLLINQNRLYSALQEFAIKTRTPSTSELPSSLFLQPHYMAICLMFETL